MLYPLSYGLGMLRAGALLRHLDNLTLRVAVRCPKQP